jgi:phage major head subunit gpT-like protein
MNLTQTIVDRASQGFRALFLKTYGGGDPKWSRIAMKTTSTGASEVYDFATSIPSMRELIGEAAVQNFSQATFTILNKEFEATVGVKQADLERDNMGLYGPKFAEMGRSAAHHPDAMVADLLNNGFADLDYTGKAFFALNKKINPSDSGKGVATFTNKIAWSLNAARFQEARAMLRERTDAKGQNLGLGDKVLLIVPPALEHTALELRDAAEIDGTTNILKGTFDVLVINQLTSDTAWFLMDDSREVKPFIVQYEVDTVFNAADRLDDRGTILNHEFIYQAYDRKNVGYGLPQLIVGSTGDA